MWRKKGETDVQKLVNLVNRIEYSSHCNPHAHSARCCIVIWCANIILMISRESASRGHTPDWSLTMGDSVSLHFYFRVSNTYEIFKYLQSSSNQSEKWVNLLESSLLEFSALFPFRGRSHRHTRSALLVWNLSLEKLILNSIYYISNSISFLILFHPLFPIYLISFSRPKLAPLFIALNKRNGKVHT